MHKIKKVILSLIIFCFVSLMMPFNISADSTYYQMSSGCEMFNQYGNARHSFLNVDSSNVRLWQSYESSLYFVLIMVSDSPFNYSYSPNVNSSDMSSCLSASNSAMPTTINGHTYYFSGVFRTNGDTRILKDLPVMTSQSLTNVETYPNESEIVVTDDTSRREVAVYYTYGDGVPGEQKVYGDLKIGFETSIAYSGGNTDAWRQNKDTIYFDRFDTLGNDLFGNLIELQAIPYSVEGASQQNIFAKVINDYVFDTVKVGHLGYWSPGQNSIDFTWEYVTNRFSPTWWGTTYDNWSLYGWYQNEHWYRVGWAYRARLVDEEDNVLIDWQWIYNGTSIDGQDVNNIINNNGLTPELVHSINNINNNNNTTNNNYYNNTVINYNSSDPTTDGSWIEQLISSILQTLGDLIGKILDFFSSIFDGLVDLIIGLFGDINPAESFFNWFSNLFNGIGDIDLTLPQFNLPNADLSSFNRLVQETLNIFSLNNFGFVIFIPLLLLIIKAVF